MNCCKKGQNGYLVKPHRPGKIAAPMIHVLANPHEAPEKITRASRFVAELDLPDVARRYARLFDAMLQETWDEEGRG